MRRIRIRRGFDVPLSGRPAPEIDARKRVTRVALLGADYPNVRPSLRVAVGDAVRLGQPLFEDRRNPGVQFTSPGSGRVVAIHRGERRALESVVVELGSGGEVEFASHPPGELAGLAPERITEELCASGLWTALRTRPYGRIPAPGSLARSIFVTALASDPLAADPAAILALESRDFAYGLAVLRPLTHGAVYVCRAPRSGVVVPITGAIAVDVTGPHPAGLPGTHIHHLDPVGANRTVWYVGYADVIAIGRLFATGRLDPARIVSLAGPAVKSPRLVRTRLGASTEDLVRDELVPGEARVVSGSPLSGRRAASRGAYLGRYHDQVCALSEGRPARFVPWLAPGRSGRARSVLPPFLGRRSWTAESRPAEGPLFPLARFERLLGVDLLANPLLRALAVGDVERAQQLGCLELEEEDVALCSFFCPSRTDYGAELRRALDALEAAL